MKIILDTNIIHQDYKMTGQRILKLFEASKKLGYELMIPEVVIDEIINQYRCEIETVHNTYIKSLSQIRKLTDTKNKAPYDTPLFVEDECNEFMAAFIQRIQDLGITIMPYPKVAHKEIVFKDLNHRKPFRNDSKGYRDALIWESVKEHLIPSKKLFDECQVLFLSENTKDFGDSGKLHSDLIEELEALGFTSEVVELVSNVDSFFKEKIDQEFEDLKVIQERLQKDYKYNRINVKEEIEKVLYDEYVVNEDFNNGYYPDGDDVSLFPQEFENPDIKDISVKEISVSSVRKLTDQTILVQCDVTSTASGDAYMYKADYYLFDEDNLPTIVDNDWNKHYMLVLVSVNIKTEVTLHVSPRFSKINSVEVRTLEVER